ncbi:MAG: ethanolamine ammonia-lyase subunit EutB, partial [Leptospiraceae bacterium]|nr:ethanolamine ammonia-lyase subunit EutB [Leptospiraceae bacterium]
MKLASKIGNRHFSFQSVKEVLAKANAPRSGDDLAGVSARDDIERVAARAVLSQLTLAQLRENPVVPYEQDEITRLVEDNLNEDAFNSVKHLSVGQFREWLLSFESTSEKILAISPGLTPEMAAAVCKLMSNMDLMIAAKKCKVIVKANNTFGLPGRLSSRVQPNHPYDDVDGIMAVAREGLSYGCGDAVLGINPATDSVESTREILTSLHRLR